MESQGIISAFTEQQLEHPLGKTITMDRVHFTLEPKNPNSPKNKNIFYTIHFHNKNETSRQRNKQSTLDSTRKTIH